VQEEKLCRSKNSEQVAGYEWIMTVANRQNLSHILFL